jgi:hypothetical protein
MSLFGLAYALGAACQADCQDFVCAVGGPLSLQDLLVEGSAAACSLAVVVGVSWV